MYLIAKKHARPQSGPFGHYWVYWHKLASQFRYERNDKS